MPTLCIGGQRDTTRVVLCVCGWGARCATLKAANAAIDWHQTHEASEGGDHAVCIEDAEPTLVEGGHTMKN